MMYNDKLFGKCLEYARVSTDNEGQAESCKNQILLCDEYIGKHPELTLVGQYVDDGISGATNERPQFNAMIERIKQGDIRYIIAKNEDRLCRSVEVDGHLQTICREYGVKIIFIESNSVFDPFDGDQVTMHGFKAVMGQQYVFHQSRVGKLAHEQKCKAKRLDATDVRFGYYWDKENKCMAINEEEAAIVRKMFEWYVYGGVGVSEIARRLARSGVYGSRSGKMLTANTVSSRLADESYKGVFHINKKGSDLRVGMNAKKRRYSRPKEEWVAVDGPAIISEELFDLAQKLREERRHIYDKPDKKETQARFKGKHLFAGKVFCGECGTQFHFRYADRAKTVGEYKDYFSKKKKEPDAECSNKKHNRIYEKTLIELSIGSINIFLENHTACIDSLVDIIREASIAASEDDEQLKSCQKRLAKIEKELNKNLMAWRDAPEASMKESFFQMYQENKKQKEELEKEIESLSRRQEDAEELEKKIEDIRGQIEKMKQVTVIDRSVVDNFIDRIIVYGDGKIAVILKFGTTQEYLNCNTGAPEMLIPWNIYDINFSGCPVPHKSEVQIVWNDKYLLKNTKAICRSFEDDKDWRIVYNDLSVRWFDRA